MQVTTSDPLERYLKPTRFMDCHNPQIIQFVQQTTGKDLSHIQQAVKLFYAVRDGIVYDPYRMDLQPQAFVASNILARGYGYCVAKALVLAAAGRAAGIPTRLGFADVKNHLNTQRLRELMGTDVFVYHGYVEFFLQGRWVKATPAFNLSLCQRSHVKPLEFDGTSDAVFQQFDTLGRRHMEYIRYHGTFADLPYDEMIHAYQEAYPRLRQLEPNTVNGSFENDIAAERQ